MKLLLYCTKGKPDLVDFREDYKLGLRRRCRYDKRTIRRFSNRV